MEDGHQVKGLFWCEGLDLFCTSLFPPPLLLLLLLLPVLMLLQLSVDGRKPSRSPTTRGGRGSPLHKGLLLCPSAATAIVTTTTSPPTTFITAVAAAGRAATSVLLLPLTGRWEHSTTGLPSRRCLDDRPQFQHLVHEGQVLDGLPEEIGNLFILEDDEPESSTLLGVLVLQNLDLNHLSAGRDSRVLNARKLKQREDGGNTQACKQELGQQATTSHRPRNVEQEKPRYRQKERFRSLVKSYHQYCREEKDTGCPMSV